MILRVALLGFCALGVACGSSSSSSPSTGGAGAAAGTGGATGGGAGAGGSAGKGAAGGGASGAAGRGGTAGASGGGAVGGGAAGDAGNGGAPRAGTGGGGESGESGASGNGGAGGDNTQPDCRVDGCPSGTECLPVDGSCGAVTCQDPDVNACVDRPVCGCDGTIYPSNCAARSAGVGTQGVVSGSRCATPPSGYFDCLGLFCDSATEYCDAHRHYGSSTFPTPCEAGEPWNAAICHPLPAACDPDATCGCVTTEPFDAGAPMTCSPSCSDNNGIARYCQSGCFG